MGEQMRMQKCIHCGGELPPMTESAEEDSGGQKADSWTPTTDDDGKVVAQSPKCPACGKRSLFPKEET